VLRSVMWWDAFLSAAITGALIIARIRAGQYLLPADLSLPLPAGMRPELTNR
jgi:hypothetical protein